MSQNLFATNILKSLNIYEVCYILDLENWQKEKRSEFREGFLKIKKDNDKDDFLKSFKK